MALERKWLAVTAIPFASDGTQFGVITVSDTAGFKDKQLVVLSSNTIPDKQYQVKQVISKTQLVVGANDNTVGISRFLDISSYKVADAATVRAPVQEKLAQPTDKDHYFAIYESSPVNADRVIGIDQYGNPYTSSNPLPVQGTFSASPIPLVPTIFNLSMPLANTEYSFNFPNKTNKFMIKIRDGMAKTKIAYVPGESGTNFITLGMGCSYGEEVVLSGQTIYFQANKTSQIMEILYWVAP
jgi:hypothetical protein